MAEIGKKSKGDPSDLTHEEPEPIAPLLPKPAKGAASPRVDLRVLNAVRYTVGGGC